MKKTPLRPAFEWFEILRRDSTEDWGPWDVAQADRLYVCTPPQYRAAFRTSPGSRVDAAAYDRVQAHWGETGPGCLLLHGPTGAGKTLAAVHRGLRGWAECYTLYYFLPAVRLAAMARDPIRHRHALAVLLEDEDAEQSADDDECLPDELLDADHLILDDISAVRLTPAFAETLYRLVEQRAHPNGGLVVTAQCGGAALLDRWTRGAPDLADIAVAIVRRLSDYCEPIAFTPGTTSQVANMTTLSGPAAGFSNRSSTLPVLGAPAGPPTTPGETHALVS